MKQLLKLSFVICYLSFVICYCLYADNKVITDVKKWKYVETEHFRIYHYPEASNLLPVLSDILEETFNTTTRFYEYRPSKKIPFFIYRNHNEFEQTNIVPVGEGTGGVTEAFKNRFVVYNNGSNKWLRDVIPHEFTHVVQFTILYEEAALLKAMRLARGIFIPLWMMEGMAEYNTRDVDATTREMVIRDVVSSRTVFSLKDLGTFGHLKPHQITPAYKLSETAYRFLVDEYGPDKPQKLIKVLRDKLDMSAAFYDTLKISPKIFMERWEEWLYEEYEDEITKYKDASDYGVKLTADAGDNIPDFNTNPVFSPDGGSIAFITDDDGINKLMLVELSRPAGSPLRSEKTRVIAEGNTSSIDLIHNEKVSFSPDGNLIAFSGEKTQKDYIYIYNLKKETLLKLPVNIFTVKSPSFSPDGEKMLFIGMRTVYNDIYEYDFKDGSVKSITDDAADQDSPVYSPDGKYIVFSQENAATLQSDIFLLDITSGEKTNLTDFPGDKVSPSFSPDGKKIVFTADEKPGSPVNIYTISLDNREIRKCTNLLTAAFTPVFSPDSKEVIFSYYRDFRKDIYSVDVSSFENPGLALGSGPEVFSVDISTHITPLSLASPVFAYRFKPSLDVLVPFIVYHSEYGLFLATYWQASELLGDHEIYNQLLYSSEAGELQYTVGYFYKKWRPQFLFSSTGENAEYLTDNEEILKEKEHTQIMTVIYPLDRFNSLEGAVSTKKYTEKNRTLDDTLIVDERTNRYSVAYNRSTVSGKYLYARFGSDFRVLYRQAFLGRGGEIKYKEYVGRYEKFFPAFCESALVLGSLTVSSEGINRRYFRLPLRGFSHTGAEYKYNRLCAATVEYRFPVFTLEKVWPMSSFFLKSLNWFFFTDSGVGFNSAEEFRETTISDIKNSVGNGMRLYLFLGGYMLPVTVDYAKRTDESAGRWNVSLGVSLSY
ncbi:MAG: PD40 domain-containing protein [Elusimicrobia bacterium]|nr:PD40 domain-containing protein [Elusimicrobiota bacterium]